MRRRDAIAQAAQAFAVFSDTPRLDAEVLMAHAAGCSRAALLLGGLDEAVPEGFAELVARRLKHEPVAYLIGSRGFWTIELTVAPGVLVPRADSETLIEAAVDWFGARAPARVLDLGTGSGALLLAALDQWPDATGVGVDRSVVALTQAAANAAQLGMGRRAGFVQGDWAAAIDGRFDLVLANPPYIGTEETLPAEVRDHEPGSALFAGRDGLDAYQVLVPQLARLIAAGGVAVVEIGATQADAVGALALASGLVPTIRVDLAGLPRAVVMRPAD